MKTKRNLLNRIIILVMCVTMLLGNMVMVHAEEGDQRLKLIKDYETYVNNKDLENYINLFELSTRNWMNELRNDPDFFLGEKIEVKQIKALEEETGHKAAFIEPDEFNGRETSVYYVQAFCDTSEVKSENIKPLHGNISYVFVFVKEDGLWKIGRVSIADISQIVAAGEGFNNENEKVALAKEAAAMARASLSVPSSICVKMTKTANKNYWGKTYVDVPFKDYILNVVPNEFIVSNGGEYLKAGTMVVKMYGWYYTIHKKYPNSPGGCDVQDTSSDQNYLATSYSNLGTYKSKMDSAYSAVKSKALVNNSGSVFLTQYVAGTTDSKTGKLGAKTALNMSKAGSTYTDILKNAYNNSTNAGGQSVKVVSH